MEGFTAGTKAVVFVGERFVEVSDDTVTLQDVCDAFAVPYDAGVYVKSRISGNPVATLPFELIVTPSAGAAATSHGTEAGPDENNADDEHADGPALLDLVCPLPDESVPETPGDGSVAAATTTPSADGVVYMGSTAAGGKDAAAETMDFTMRELVKLGAVELLSADSPQRIAQMPCYDPANAAPGLLRGMVFPQATYSPYRTQRDPLRAPDREAIPSKSGARAADESRAGATFSRHEHYKLDGPPYTSSLDVYGVPMVDLDDFPTDPAAEEQLARELLRRRTDLVPLTAEQTADFFSGIHP